MTEKHTAPGARLSRGVWSENPLLRLALGICPALAVTTRATNGLGLGITTACVMICVSLLASLIGKVVSERGRFPVFMLLSAAFAGIAWMVLKGWQPALNDALGLFVPLVAVNCLILNRAEAFAADNGPAAAIADAVGMGVGYTLALTALGIIRELIGHGSVFGAAVLPAGYEPMLMAVMPAGGFLALGLLMGIYNAIAARKRKGASA